MRKRLATSVALLVGTALVVLLQCAGRLLGGEHVPAAPDASEFFAVSVERTVERPLDSTDVPLSLAEQALVGERWFALTTAVISVAGSNEAHQANAAFVREDMFASLGVRMALGAACNDPRGVVLSHAFHQRALGGSPGVIGSTLLASGRSMQPDPVVLRVCGVAPPGFRGVRIGRPHDLWVPWEGWRDLLFPGSEPESEVERFFPLELYVRAEGASQRMSLERRMEAAGVAAGEWHAGQARVSLQPGIALDALRRASWRDRARSYLLLSGLMLLLGLGAVLAQVMLRSVRSAREESTRAALGESGRGRATRHLLSAVRQTTPAVVAGGAIGFAAMFPLLRVLEALGAGWIAQLFDPLAYGLAAVRITLWLAALTIACVAGLTLLLSRPTRHGFDHLRSPFRRTRSMLLPLACLLAVAACVAALAAASVRHTMAELASSLARLEENVSFSALDFTREAATLHIMSRRPVVELVQRLETADPRIALASSPPVGYPAIEELLSAGGKKAVFVNHVTPNYFALVRLVPAGRPMRPDGGEAVVTRRFAEEHLGPGDPVGRRLRLSSVFGGEREVTVVGVVPDAHRLAPRSDTTPLVYLAATEFRHVQVGMAPSGSAAAMRTIMEDVLSTPGVRVEPPRALRSLARDAFAVERVEAWVLAVAGLFLLLVALHGAFATERTMMLERAAETAVRRALGGSPPRIALQALGSGGAAVAALLATGTAAAAWVAWLARPGLGHAAALGLGAGAMALVALCAFLGLGRVLGAAFERDLVQFLKRDA